jgi:RNA polymerase sigma-70 factor (ECF subfamily)
MDTGARPGAWKAHAEEAALVSRAQRGDRAAFLTLLRYHDRSVHRLVYALVRDPEKAGALTHETFVRAWNDIKHIPAGQTFYPWLTRLARGLAITHTRRRVSAPELGVRDQPPEVDPEAEAEAARVVVDPTDAERAVLCERAFSELNVDQQTILFLRVSERLSYSEIAKTLDIPFGATLSRLASARAALRTRLVGPGQKAA